MANLTVRRNPEPLGDKSPKVGYREGSKRGEGGTSEERRAKVWKAMVQREKNTKPLNAHSLEAKAKRLSKAGVTGRAGDGRWRTVRGRALMVERTL